MINNNQESAAKKLENSVGHRGRLAGLLGVEAEKKESSYLDLSRGARCVKKTDQRF